MQKGEGRERKKENGSRRQKKEDPWIGNGAERPIDVKKLKTKKKT